ncbi:MAG: hypothetical protein ACKV2Q_16235 [Planctomycetaceae bacterium]
MGEPLFDGISAAIVVSGVVAVGLLRWAAGETVHSDRERRLNILGHLWLGIAVSLLLYRWIESVTSLPSEARPNLWRSGVLTAMCGIGLAAAMKAVIGGARTHRVAHWSIAAACAVVALGVASAWGWALLVLVLSTSGLALAMWLSQRASSVGHLQQELVSQPREPVLACMVSAALLLLLLSTWQHVAENETQRQTRSARYSAWPRPTALRDAWERTGWTAKSGAADSSDHVSQSASREQHVALGLGLLLLVVAVAAWHKSHPQLIETEADHAG